MKKGFTLIELLAVIVILSIIALIATPLIINVIDEARKKSFEKTAYGIVEAGKIGYTSDMIEGINGEVIFTYTDGLESVSTDGRVLNYKGAKPQNGKVIINNEGKVALAIHDGTYCAEKSYNESKITTSLKEEEECIILADVSGASVPNLAEGMIPVKWDTIGQTWIKADINNEAGDNQWYNYDDKMWANAVTVDATNRTTYESAEPGLIIPQSDINAMWVWIPRYAYSITSGYHTDHAGKIEVKFLNNNTNISSDGSTIEETPVYSGDSQTNYVTHPAFTFGSYELSGIWVAKFETSPDINSQCYNDHIYCNDINITPKIIPNVYSWVYSSVNTAFTVLRNMENLDNIYGLNNSEVDTHLMKNSEWATVAYLSKSVYGKNNEEIWINSVNQCRTGCAGNSSSDSIVFSCNSYETMIGQEASTTGNIYGVYDMSGGSWEYVMANVGNLSAMSQITDISAINEKYIDRYNVADFGYSVTYYGHALYETSLTAGTYNSDSWYDGDSMMLRIDEPWVVRGGMFASSNHASIYSFSAVNGGPNINAQFTSFRPALIVEEVL